VPQTIPAGNVYLAYSAISGSGSSLQATVFLTRSIDCGASWSAPIPLSGPSQAVSQGAAIAERAANMQLERVVVSISGGKPGSELISASIDVKGKTVAEGDIARVLSVGSQHLARPDRAITLRRSLIRDEAGSLTSRVPWFLGARLWRELRSTPLHLSARASTCCRRQDDRTRKGRVPESPVGLMPARPSTRTTSRSRPEV